LEEARALAGRGTKLEEVVPQDDGDLVKRWRGHLVKVEEHDDGGTGQI
jgi:hypothetical protein